MRRRFAAGDPDRAGVLLHALRQAESPCYQRAQRQRAQIPRRVQGLARSGLRLLFDEKAGASGEANDERRQEFSNGAALDDQPLMSTISLPSHGGMNDGSSKPQEANPTLHVTFPAATTPK